MNTKQKSIKFNFFMNIVLTMSSFIFPLITFPYVSRILSSSGIGKISFATSIIAYFSMIAQMGIPTYGIRACAKIRDDKEKLNKIVSEILTINLIMTIISYILLFACVIFIPKLHDSKDLILIVSSTMIFNMIGVEWLYKSLEQYTYITIRSISFKLIAMILMFLFIHEKNDYIIYGIISIFASSASNVLNFLHLHSFVSLKSIRWKDLKKHLKPIFTFFVMSCAVTVYTNLDTIMLGFITNDSIVGFYNVAIKVRTVLLSIITSLGTVILPRASYYVQNNMMEKFKKISKKAIKFVLLISIPLCIFFMVYNIETILILSGDNFLSASSPLLILLPTIVFVGLSNITGIQMLIPLDKEKYVLYSEILGACVDLAFNAFLIPLYGCVGAAIGTLLAEIVVFIYQYIILKKNNYKLFNDINICPIIIGSLVTLPFLILTERNIPNIFLSIIIGFIFYFTMYILTLVIMKDEFVISNISSLKNKLRKKDIKNEKS